MKGWRWIPSKTALNKITNSVSCEIYPTFNQTFLNQFLRNRQIYFYEKVITFHHYMLERPFPVSLKFSRTLTSYLQSISENTLLIHNKICYWYRQRICKSTAFLWHKQEIMIWLFHCNWIAKCGNSMMWKTQNHQFNQNENVSCHTQRA